MLLGGNGGDFLKGGAGDDLARGAEGRDTMIGDGGDDRLFGGGGIDDGTGRSATTCSTAKAGHDSTLDGGRRARTSFAAARATILRRAPRRGRR